MPDSNAPLYDDPMFFAGYKKLRQIDNGLNGSTEQPAVRSRMLDLAGRDILDLGCGFGDFLRYAATRGARTMIGVDQSRRMIEEAQGRSSEYGIDFRCEDITAFRAGPDSFDIVVSSLALHYIEAYADVVSAVHDWLRPGGIFLFTVEHPICTANPIGWVRAVEGDREFWPLDRYQEEGARMTHWFIDGVRKYHRTVETYVNALIGRGFRLAFLGEPKPVSASNDIRPEDWEHMRRPPLLLIEARKRDVVHDEYI